ncbi:MAG: DMT family transporter [Paracoccaceae bacterium]|nr:DMT family transporter [Paracoccaceae bacterium]
MSDNLRGAFLMVASMAAFVFNDTFVKLLGATLPLFQILLLRGAVSLIFIAGLCQYFKAWRFHLVGKDWALIGIRSLGDIGASYFFLSALFHMPLANVTAIFQLLPLTVALGGALFFSERMGWRRVLAISFGFSGIFLIVRPGTEGFGVHTYYALIAVICVTLRDLVTRRISPGVPSLMVTFANAFSILLYSVLAMFWVHWVPLSGQNILHLAVASFFISWAYLLSVLVMRKGDVSFIAPFRYTGLIWALFTGLIFFGHWPDTATLFGAVIIIGSGLYTMWRENYFRKNTNLA